MKKYLIILLALVLCVSVALCACSKEEETQETEAGSDVVTTSADESADSESDTESVTESDTDPAGGKEDGGNSGFKEDPLTPETTGSNPWGEAEDGADTDYTKNY